MSKSHVDLLVVSSHPNSPAKFGVHRLYGTRNNSVCNIIPNSKSNSNTKVPVPRFTNTLFWPIMLFLTGLIESWKLYLNLSSPILVASLMPLGLWQL